MSKVNKPLPGVKIVGPNSKTQDVHSNKNEDEVVKHRKLEKPAIIILQTPEVVLVDNTSSIEQEESITWLTIGTIVLNQDDLNLLSGEMRLNDKHMNAGQFMLKSQFPSIKVLSSTLRSSCYGCWISQYLQILHCKGNYWFAVSSFGCAE